MVRFLQFTYFNMSWSDPIPGEIRDDQGICIKNPDTGLFMLFIARDGQIVGIHPGAVPLSTASISVGAPSALVLEVNGGWTARHGIRAGDRLEFRGVPGLS